MVETKTVFLQDTELPYGHDREPWIAFKGATIQLLTASKPGQRNIDLVVVGKNEFALSYPCPINDKERAIKLIARLFEKIMEGNTLVQPNKTASIRKTLAYLGELSVLKDAILTEIGDNSSLSDFVTFISNSTIHALQVY